MKYKVSISSKKRDIVSEYETALKTLEEHNLEVSVKNFFCDEDGIYLWHFSAELVAVDNEKDSYKVVGRIEGGIDIPSSIELSDEDSEFQSRLDLCDSLFGDIYSTIDVILDKNDEIDKGILAELDLPESSSFESDIAYIHNFSAESPTYMKYLIDTFPIIEEGLSTRYCQLVICPLSIDNERDTLNYMVKAGWGIREIDSQSVVAYKRT